MKKRLVLITTILLVIAMLPLEAFASNDVFDVQVVNKAGTYNAYSMIAINTNTSSGSDSCKYKGLSETDEIFIDESEYPEAEISDIEIDDDGNVLIQLDYDRYLRSISTLQSEEIEPDRATKKEYKVGDKLTLYDAVGSSRRVPMICLYVGEHCTVWGAQAKSDSNSNGDPEAICITKEIAKTIGDEFDNKVYHQMNSAFGEGNDPDGDGKLAIRCFDMGNNYDTQTVDKFSGSYTAGYFSPGDMSSMDNINIDTYPLMGTSKSKPFDRVLNSTHTLVHEYQHLINDSYSSKINDYYGMEDALNEAFSMAAEHMICGSDATKSRVEYFNNPESYTLGSSIYYWGQTMLNHISLDSILELAMHS